MAKRRDLQKNEEGKPVFPDPFIGKVKYNGPSSYPLTTAITCRCGERREVDLHKEGFHCEKCGMTVPAIKNVPAEIGKSLKKKYGKSWELKDGK